MKISEINPLTGKAIGTRQHIMIFPNSHYVTSSEKMERAIKTIEKEMDAIRSRFGKNSIKRGSLLYEETPPRAEHPFSIMYK